MTPASFRIVSLALECSGNLTTHQRWWSISGYSGEDDDVRDVSAKGQEATRTTGVKKEAAN
jgi:hypothetical protein